MGQTNSLIFASNQNCRNTVLKVNKRNGQTIVLSLASSRFQKMRANQLFKETLPSVLYVPNFYLDH